MPKPEGVHVSLPPPLLFFIALGIGVGLGYLRPAPFAILADPVRWALAALLAGVSLGFGAGGLLTLRRRKTSPEFARAVAVLVQEGPFRLTRNPLYVALCALLAFFAALLDNLWVLLLLPVLVLALDRLVIACEEVYLRERFGDAYEGYCRKVRRWL